MTTANRGANMITQLKKAIRFIWVGETVAAAGFSCENAAYFKQTCGLPFLVTV